jgi:hypothetical protein
MYMKHPIGSITPLVTQQQQELCRLLLGALGQSKKAEGTVGEPLGDVAARRKQKEWL